jgi:hypothetical protein
MSDLPSDQRKLTPGYLAIHATSLWVVPPFLKQSRSRERPAQHKSITCRALKLYRRIRGPADKLLLSVEPRSPRDSSQFITHTMQGPLSPI